MLAVHRCCRQLARCMCPGMLGYGGLAATCPELRSTECDATRLRRAACLCAATSKCSGAAQSLLPGKLCCRRPLSLIPQQGWEYTVCERTLPGTPDPERRLLVTVSFATCLRLAPLPLLASLAPLVGPWGLLAAAPRLRHDRRLVC